MFWKKKKPKRKQPVKKQIPKHIADNLKYGESVAEGFKKGVSEVSEKPNRKKPAGKNSEKHLDARKEFLRVFRQLTYRHRSYERGYCASVSALLYLQKIRKLGDYAGRYHKYGGYGIYPVCHSYAANHQP